MAKFLSTRNGVWEIENLIKNAGDRLILISPYLKFAKDFKELLEYRSGKGRKTTIIFGKKDLIHEEIQWLQGLKGINLKFYQDLHAKCFANDDRIVLTSMNLYEFSMANNKEMGVLIDKNDPADTQLFADAMQEAEYIIELSQPHNSGASKPVASATNSLAKKSSPEKEMGYCIRTRVRIPFNIKKPLSPDAYLKWKEFANPDYFEKFCHFSGDPSNGETSVNKPILNKYWKKAQAVHGI